jgi:hypothetical protein
VKGSVVRERAGWLLCAVPLIGLAELVLHVKQTGPDVVPDRDWERAREVVRADLKPDDLVLFEPFWADPIGRELFGGEIMTLKRAGYSDFRRWHRVYEVSIRDAHEAELAGWKKVKEDKAGGVTVRLLENPDYTPVLDDLVDLAKPDRLSVTAGDAPCVYQHGASAGGSTVVPQGLLVPADKFVCSGGHVGVAVMHALDHHGHVCLYATPMSTPLHLRFKDVAFGTRLVGHSGVQWVDERTPTPEKIELRFSAFDHVIAPVFHKVGKGWTGFELPTDEYAGKKGELVVDIDPAKERQFCFEATTRQ